MAQARFTAVGRDCAKTVAFYLRVHDKNLQSWKLSIESAPRLTPIAAATPIAGAPRMTIVLMAEPYFFNGTAIDEFFFCGQSCLVYHANDPVYIFNSFDHNIVDYW